MNSNKFTQPLEFGSHDSDPTWVVEDGVAYYNTLTTKLRIKENNVWVDYTTSATFTAYQTLLTNASRSVAYIRDLKASGTAGGTFTSGSWQTRALNTLDDPQAIVTSLTSNTFTLPAGRYVIDGTATAYRVNGHQTKIRNVTDATDVFLGTTGYSSGAALSLDLTISHSNFTGTINIATAKTFSLQHFCKLTGTYGSAASAGVSEQYSFIRIMKLL